MTKAKDDKYALYRKSLGTLVKEYALEAGNAYKRAKGSKTNSSRTAISWPIIDSYAHAAAGGSLQYPSR
jgi:hypothetical protein